MLHYPNIHILVVIIYMSLS